MSSRSATVLVIFIVACVAFCLASVFGAMTGPISILPTESNDGILDNLSAITDSNDKVTTYGYDDSQSYSKSNDDNSGSNVETTTDDSKHSDSGSGVETTTDNSKSSSTHSESSSGSSSSGSSSSSNVETTTDNSK